MPNAVKLNLGFSTADADHPSLTYDCGNLQLRFVDWQDVHVLVTFYDVRRFEWTDEPDDYFNGEPYDGTCLIQNSRWAPSIDTKEFQHYRLNFNASGGRLEVACVSLEVSKTER